MSLLSRFQIENKTIHLMKKLTVDDLQHNLSCVRPLNRDSEADYQAWCDIVNVAYKEEQYDLESAKQTLHAHLFLENTETYFYLSDQGVPIGTISIGSYRNRPEIAGDFRLAVHPNYQKMGIWGGVLFSTLIA